MFSMSNSVNNGVLVQVTKLPATLTMFLSNFLTKLDRCFAFYTKFSSNYRCSQTVSTITNLILDKQLPTKKVMSNLKMWNNSPENCPTTSLPISQKDGPSLSFTVWRLSVLFRNLLISFFTAWLLHLVDSMYVSIHRCIFYSSNLIRHM